MLQLCNIVKTYGSGDMAVPALRGVSIAFRHNEFVSILGQSGCGKTTLLNIVGGLDRYTSGDLIINGRSTRDFGSRDWDTYRNHTIGFVFQSYNLIPHQTVLQNVELALTLSGVSKAERRRRAKAALEQVGLGSQLRKKPGQMSGGQMQRVAIARALVNNPDIILADEPTGALDTETSVQVMELLKQVAKDRLVIMVTHNPALAEQYSTRIVRMLDGQVTGDSAPLTEQELAAEQTLEQEKAAKRGKKKEKKPSMSFFTSFGLSLKNLFTKKGRTILTSFAGSIGIIGIALILSVSRGMNAYISALQEDTLASYPLTLEATHVDATSLLNIFVNSAKADSTHENDAVYQKAVIYDLINSLNQLEEDKNDLASFKSYLEQHMADENDTTGLRTAVSGVQYSYDLQLQVYTKSPDGSVVRSDTTELMQELIAQYMGTDMANRTAASQSGSLSSLFGGMGQSTGMWQEMLPGEDGSAVSPLLKKQYDVIYGSWPQAYDEVVLVVDENNELDDMTLYALGLKSREDIDAIMKAAVDKTPLEKSDRHWSYEEICATPLRTVPAAACYTADGASGTYTDLRESEAGMKYLYDNGLTLKVVGIIRPSEEAVSAMLTGSIGYTTALTDYIIAQANDSAAVKAQQADPATDIFTGLRFKDASAALTEEEKQTIFRQTVQAQDEAGKAATYTAIMSIPPQEQLDAAVAQTAGSADRAAMEEAMLTAMSQQMSVNSDTLKSYLGSMSDEDLAATFRTAVEEQVRAQYAAGVKAQLAGMSNAQLAAAMTAALNTYTPAQCAAYYDAVLQFSDSTYEENLVKLGKADADKPTAINLYAAAFADKDAIEDAIAAYNEQVGELSRIAYTDYVGIMMSSVTTIINAITYVLIAFVAISLIVSSIMIGVITLISVQERTKEIGILRAIGASKRDVSGMFNAETIIIGFTAGGIGVLLTYLLCIPINLLIHHLTGISNLSAYLPLPDALVLIAISVGLTLISGIIPSRSAARKDPVVALRTE